MTNTCQYTIGNGGETCKSKAVLDWVRIDGQRAGFCKRHHKLVKATWQPATSVKHGQPVYVQTDAFIK
jgi:hypothetical protein